MHMGRQQQQTPISSSTRADQMNDSDYLPTTSISWWLVPSCKATSFERLHALILLVILLCAATSQGDTSAQFPDTMRDHPRKEGSVSGEQQSTQIVHMLPAVRCTCTCILCLLWWPAWHSGLRASSHSRMRHAARTTALCDACHTESFETLRMKCRRKKCAAPHNGTSLSDNHTLT